MSLSRYLSSPFGHLPMLYDQDFGLGVSLHDLVDATLGHLRSGYLGPVRHEIQKSDAEVDKNMFEVMVDVQQFSPKEILVKVVGDEVVVEGKHEEKKDEHGYIYRRFVRRYKLPEGVKSENVTSNLSSDGILTILAPKVKPIEDGNVRHVPIRRTGIPAAAHHQVSQDAHHASHAHQDCFGSHVHKESKPHHTYPHGPHCDHHGCQHNVPHSKGGSHSAHKASHAHQDTQEPPLAIKETAANPHKEVRVSK